jgi:hypothetical protein
MRTSHVRNWALSLLLSTLPTPFLPGAAGAQDTDTVRRELESVRQELDAVRAQYEGRLRELTRRLEILEQDRSAAPPGAPPAASTATTPAPASPGAPASTPEAGPATAAGGGTPAAAPAASPAAAESPSVRDLLTPRQPFALAQPGRALLFDMGVSGDFVGNATSSTRERRQDGTFAGRENRFFPRELELSFFGRVDPYASAVVRLSAGEEPSGVEPSDRSMTVSLDEANVTLLSLPFGTVARFGVMRPRFGTLNSVHQDDLPQVDRPNVLTRFFGEEQLDGEAGLEAFWVLPTSIFHEIAVGVFNGDNEVAFGRGSLSDPLVTARWRTFFELEEAGGLQLDVSVASGVTADSRRNTVLGFGAKYKWAGGGSGFPLLTVAGEVLYGLRNVSDDESPSGRKRFDRWGAYLYAQYDWTRRWAAGLRGDWTELPTAHGDEWAISPYVQFRLSEFLRFRLQYKHTEGSGAVQRVADEIFLQGTFILGAHPVERF